MKATARERGLLWSFAGYAAIALVPVTVLGASLRASYRHEARRRGVAEGRSEAALLARTMVEPVLDGTPVRGRLDGPAAAALDRAVGAAVRRGDVIRLRLRTLDGLVAWSDDGSGFSSVPEDEAVEAGRGETIGLLTRVNADANDDGPSGEQAVEVYLPLRAGSTGPTVAVLEVYLPYAPIEADVSAGLAALSRDLAAGLALLYVTLFLLTLWVSRGLRRQLHANRVLAERDTLTGLANRTLFLRRVSAALDSAAGHGSTVVVALVDLDRFKEVNDTLGHPHGDRVLVEIAHRLGAMVGRRDTVARLGGDEFGLVLDVPAGEAEATLASLRRAIAQEVEVGGVHIALEASIGYAVSPDDGAGVDELLQRADVAMYVAKARRDGVRRYDPADDHYDAANLEVAAELHRAIPAGELVLHYQPKAWLGDGTIRSVEALVRWQHPTRGLLGPDRFLPVAEQTDVIDALTEWVVGTALRDVTTRPGLAGLDVAVNISARNLADPRFADRVVALLRETGATPDRLVLEITETALLVDPLHAADVLRRLATMGVRVSLDDFGCGQTSLGYLSALPLHELKIDRSFVADITDNPAHAAIVRSMVDLGHNLGLTVVAEGVETEPVRASVHAAGCDVMQGWLLARPMPAADLTRWLGGVHEPAAGVVASQ